MKLIIVFLDRLTKIENQSKLVNVVCDRKNPKNIRWKHKQSHRKTKSIIHKTHSYTKVSSICGHYLFNFFSCYCQKHKSNYFKYSKNLLSFVNNFLFSLLSVLCAGCLYIVYKYWWDLKESLYQVVIRFTYKRLYATFHGWSGR